jgi:hypothetical protein
MGLFMKGDGKGGFTPWSISDAGFFVGGDAKALSVVMTPTGPAFVATQNQDSVLVFARTNAMLQKTIAVDHLDVSAEIHFVGNRKQKIEFYHGNGFLSQSSRFLEMPENATKIVITNYKGDKREVQP